MTVVDGEVGRRSRWGAALLTTALVLGFGMLGAVAPAAAAPPDKVRVIVQLQSGADPGVESRKATAAGAQVRHVYRSVFPGFAAELPQQAVDRLRSDPRVVSVEADGVVTATATQSSAGPNLDRIDQKSLPLDGSYTYPDAAGSGVTAYVIDTGIAPHSDFDSRLSDGFTAVADGNGTTDCNGHGTHVAGTLGGSTYGVAKAVTLVPVRVLDCDGTGSWSGVIAGLDWAKTNHTTGRAVANLSLGGPVSSSVDAAVQALINDGVTVAIAAGNGNANACNSSPGRVGAALTVGAVDSTDTRASFSNYGACLDVFAPGVNVVSDAPGGGTRSLSGTSMAAPHVAGAAAIVLSKGAASPSTVASRLSGAATTGVVKNAGARSPNRLLFVSP